MFLKVSIQSINLYVKKQIEYEDPATNDPKFEKPQPESAIEVFEVNIEEVT